MILNRVHDMLLDIFKYLDVYANGRFLTHLYSEIKFLIEIEMCIYMSIKITSQSSYKRNKNNKIYLSCIKFP